MDNFQNDTYQNTGYRVDRQDYHIITLDSKSVSSAARAANFLHSDVYYELIEPLYVDTSTDVFLEFLHIQNCDFSDSGGTEKASHLELTPYFCIDIPELDIKTYSNHDYLSNKFIVPNDVFGDTDDMQNDSQSGNGIGTYHVKIKSNFISTIQPKTIRGFHVSITGLVPSIDHGETGISTISNGNFEGQFNKYILSNRVLDSTNYDTCGAVKLALLFKKRKKLNKQLLKLQDGSYKNGLYQNTQYFNDRSLYQVLVLDSIMSTTTVSLPAYTGNTAPNSRNIDFFYNNVVFNLLEPLYIDTKCEMYIEYVSLNNQIIIYNTSTYDDNTSDTERRSHLEASSAFYIDIPELKIKTFTNDHYAANKYVLPNEIYGKTDKNANDNDANVKTYHIRLKRNFIGILEPTTLRRLTMSITADDARTGSETDKYFLANRYVTASNTDPSSSVQVAILFKKIWD
jgi:hypothetical protein